MPYNSLPDPALNDNRAVASGTCAAKFCSMGFVTSQKWFSAYITVLDGLLCLYDSEDSFNASPYNHIVRILITRDHTVTTIKMKQYAVDPTKPITFFCFYLMKKNVIGSSSKELKIGCVDLPRAEAICRAIEVTARNTD